MKKQNYSYQEIFLKPNYSPVLSRSDVDLSVKFGPRKFKLPVVPANMVCTMDGNMARWMSENDYFYIMHRFNENAAFLPNQDNWQFLKIANDENWKTISISLGVQDYDMEFIRSAKRHGFRIDYITFDIAHGFSSRMEQMLNFTSNFYNQCILENSNFNRPFIIAGNVATPDAVECLERWGADATKVGISQGSGCSTYDATGFGVPMYSSVAECAWVAKKPIIADGGIRSNGDIAKAIHAGATMVMAGGIFAQCLDSPAKCVTKLFKTDEVKLRTRIMDSGGVIESGYDNAIIKKNFKTYYGSASAINKGSNKHVEGRVIELECNGLKYEEKLTEIKESLQSATSYAGGNIRDAYFGIVAKS